MAQDYNNDPYTPYPATESAPYYEPPQSSRRMSPVLIAVIVFLLLMCCCCVFILLFYFVIGDILTDAMGITGLILPLLTA